jgi:hypothetical protein
MSFCSVAAVWFSKMVGVFSPSWACAQSIISLSCPIFPHDLGAVSAAMAVIAQRPEGLRSLCRQESFTKAAQEHFVMQGAGEICGMAEATSLNNPWACASRIAVARPLPPDFCMTGALIGGSRRRWPPQSARGQIFVAFASRCRRPMRPPANHTRLQREPSPRLEGS